jgi:hypothetical protein
VVIATLEKAENAAVLAEGRKKPAKPGQDFLEGQGLESGGASLVRFPDGTRLEIGPRTVLREITTRNGKRIDVARGVMHAVVTEQPAERPMVLVTPQAEIRVLGTAFRLSVDPDDDGATHLEVEDGKVRAKRLADGKAVDVARGTSVRVAKGTATLTAQPDAGLIGHWKLDQATGKLALDSSGNLHHGKLMGDATWVAGRGTGAIRFGPGGHLAIPGLKVPDAFTVSFWVYQPALAADQDWFVNFGGNQFMVMREGNMEKRQFRTGFDNPQEFLTVASVIQAGQWAHFAITCDGSELRLFANGQSEGHRKVTRRDLRPDVTFGRVAAGSEAILDDLRIYDRAVGATDVARILAGAHPIPARRR